MSGRRLPEGYNEIGRWTLNQASVKELLLFGLVGLFAFFASLAAAGFIVWAATGSAETTIDGGTFFSGLLLGGVLGAMLHEAVHGVFFLAFGGRPRFGFKPWTRFGPVFYAAPPRELPRQASVPRRRVGAGSAADRCAGGSTSIRGRGRPARLRRHVGLCAQRRRVGGRHAHDAQGDVLPRATRFEDTGEGFVAYGSAGSLESP